MTIDSPRSQAPEGQSPGTKMVQLKIYVDRAKLLLQGRELDLMKQLSEGERAYVWFPSSLSLAWIDLSAGLLSRGYMNVGFTPS